MIMKNFKENAMMQEMSLQEMQEVNGGIIPLVILGAAVSGKALAIATASVIFLAGVYVGCSQNSNSNSSNN